MNIKRYYSLLYLLLVIFPASWYCILYVTYIRTPERLIEADFRAFYAAGKIARNNGASQVYDLELEQAEQERITGGKISQGELLTYNHPPLLLPVLTFFAGFPYATAYMLYSIALTMIGLFSLGIFYKTLKIQQFSEGSTWLVVLAMALFEPLFLGVLKGQDTALVVLGLAIWLNGLLKSDQRQAGLGLALTTIRPQLAIFLAIPFLFRKQKVFAWFSLGAIILMIYSYLLVGRQGFMDYLSLLKLSAAGQEFGLNPAAMFNFSGLMLRIFPEMQNQAVNILKWVLYGSALAGMSWYWTRSKGNEAGFYGTLVVTALFFSPHLHYHDLAGLLIPMLVVVLMLKQEQLRIINYAPVIILTISFVLILAYLSDALYYSVPYALMLGIVICLHPPGKKKQAEIQLEIKTG